MQDAETELRTSHTPVLVQKRSNRSLLCLIQDRV